MKQMKHSFFIFTLLLLASVSYAQTIFTYGGVPVSKEEFLRMYTKNNMGKKADMSAAALNDYITLYSRFKMKVAEAEAKKIDTIPSIKLELDNYKKQLAKSYLTDKDVISNLGKETYERMKKDVEVAHIMISVPRGVQDSTVAYKRIDSIYNALLNGANFAKMAQDLSQDKSTATTGGNIGYITALQTPYEFESVAFATPTGIISKPFRTNFGYHIIKKLNERQALGEVQVAQIMLGVRKSNTVEQNNIIKNKADSILNELRNGANWNDMVKAFSEDKYSISNNGELQPFGVNAMTLDFEKTAFGLSKPGELGGPILTEYGYHIIKLIKKMPLKPYDSIKTEINKKIERDGRMEIARKAFINKLKAKGNFKEYPENFAAFIKMIPDSLVKNNTITIPTIMNNKTPLFSIKNKTEDFTSFYNFIMQTSRGKLSGDRTNAVQPVYNVFTEKSLMDFEENNLATENTEYKNLVKEYRDGIILFELTDKSVWTKASTDSLGLAKYFANNKSKYQWGESFEGKIIRFTTEKDANEFYSLLKNNTIDTALVKINEKDNKASVEEGKFEYSKLDAGAKLATLNKCSSVLKSSEGNYYIVYPKVINNNPTQKTLAEARGYAIADYQDYLEKKWIADMEAKYPVKVNETVLKGMEKK